MAALVRYFAAYLPSPDERCSHPGIANTVTDRGIDLGPTAVLVRVPVAGGRSVVKVMCRTCGRTGGALPRNARLDGEATDVNELPDRDAVRPAARIPGIPTTYRSTNFRSRLEARWAAFFDLIGWRWTYEPLDADGYIPDFLIHGEAPFLVEVGPCVTEADYLAKAEKPAAYTDMPTLVVGVSPIMDERDFQQAAGLLVNEFADGRSGRAYWYVCGVCDLDHVYGDNIQRPCGHPFAPGCGTTSVADHWARAGNAVQWNPR